MTPIFPFGFSSVWIDRLIAAKTIWNCPSHFVSSSAGFHSGPCVNRSLPESVKYAGGAMKN
jgi:hypothetical protein